MQGSLLGGKRRECILLRFKVFTVGDNSSHLRKKYAKSGQQNEYFLQKQFDFHIDHLIVHYENRFSHMQKGSFFSKKLP
jgi:hypothetical protein